MFGGNRKHLPFQTICCWKVGKPRYCAASPYDPFLPVEWINFETTKLQNKKQTKNKQKTNKKQTPFFIENVRTPTLVRRSHMKKGGCFFFFSFFVDFFAFY